MQLDLAVYFLRQLISIATCRAKLYCHGNMLNQIDLCIYGIGGSQSLQCRMTEDRDFLPFKRLFRELKLQTDVGLKLHKMKRTDWDKKFHAVYAELDVLIDPVEQHQKELAESNSLLLYTVRCIINRSRSSSTLSSCILIRSKYLCMSRNII